MKPLQTVVLAIALLVAFLAPEGRSLAAGSGLGSIVTASPFRVAVAKAGAVVTRANLAAFGVGLGAGIYVTQKLHKSTGFWAKRIPGTRYRMADLPVGGTIALGAALLTRNHPELSHVFLSLSAGMTLGAVGTGVADPLPKQQRQHP